jgi:hypothetical protein
MPTPSETLRLQRELALKGKRKPKLISRNKVPLPNGFPAWIDETKEMIFGGSYTALREVFNKYIRAKKLNIPDQAAYLDLAICEGIRRSRGNSTGYCETPTLGTPNYQLIQQYHSDPRGPKGLRRGQHGRDALAWKALHLAALDGKMTPDFIENFTRQIGCGSCKSSWKTILRNNPPNYANAFDWSVSAHNMVSKKLHPPKPEISIDAARGLWSA